MSITFFNPGNDLLKQGCPQDVLDNAITSLRRVAKLVWDEPDVPEHCKGCVQWSVRPYRVSDKCDGTRDSNAMLVCWEFCQRTNLDLRELFSAAYPLEENIFDDALYLAHLMSHRDATEIPPVTDETITHLLQSLYSMNWRSLVDVLEQAWSERGYIVDALD